MIRAVLAGAAVAALVTFATFSGVTAFRAKVVRDPITAAVGALDVLIPDEASSTLHTPFAVISGVTNHGVNTLDLIVTLDGHDVCRSSIGAGHSTRLNCTAAVANPVPRILSFRGNNQAWTLDDVEVATHFGRTTGLGDYYIFPRGSQAPARTPIGVALLIGLAAAILAILPTSAAPKYAVTFAYVAAAAAVVIGAAALVTQFVSPFVIVMSYATVFGWVLAAATPAWWTLLVRIAETMRIRLSAETRSMLAAVTVALIVLSSLVSVVNFQLRGYGGNYSAFAHINKVYYDGHPVLSKRQDIRETLRIEDPGGFDGQFVYFAAFDPLVREFAAAPKVYAQFIDAPPYRLSRIGFVWLASLASLGHWRALPEAMTWVLLAITTICAFVIARTAQREGLSAAWGLAPLAVHAVWQSLMSDVPESVLFATVLMAAVALSRGRVVTATLLLAFAMLTRETTLVFVATTAAFAWFRSGRKFDAVLIVSSVLPFLVWRLYLGSVLYPAFGMAAYVNSSPVVGIPFAGLVRLWSVVAAGEYITQDPAMARAAIAFPLLLVFGVAIASWSAWTRPSAITVAGAIYALLAVSLNYGAVWRHIGNGQRTSFELFTMLALMAVLAKSLELSAAVRRALTTFWISAGIFVFFLSYDAASTRHALPILVTAGAIAAITRVRQLAS